MCTLKLHLVDPTKDERFGDAMIAFVNIKKPVKSRVPRLNLAEESKLDSNANGIRTGRSKKTKKDVNAALMQEDQ